MKKLACRKYLNQATTREQLYIYTKHLLRAHRQNAPHEIALCELATSKSFNRRAYEEVDRLAQQVEENYNKR